jgi:hypothetical protein
MKDKLLNTGYEYIPSNRLVATEAHINPSIHTFGHAGRQTTFEKALFHIHGVKTFETVKIARLIFSLTQYISYMRN